MTENLDAVFLPFPNSLQFDAFKDILLERGRQDKKWGAVADGCFDDRSDGEWLLILMEEVGEWSEECLNTARGKLNRNQYVEAVQVAAVALAIVEQLRRDGVHKLENTNERTVNEPQGCDRSDETAAGPYPFVGDDRRVEGDGPREA